MSKRTGQRPNRPLRPALERLEQIALLTTISESLTQPGAFTVNGSAVITKSGVQMTNALEQGSSVWFNNLLNSDDYTASFNFALSNPGGIGWADGFTFAVADASQTSSTAIGGIGAGIGYAGLSGYAIEFDTFYNPNLDDPDYVHVGLDLDGSVISAAVSGPLPFDIEGGGNGNRLDHRRVRCNHRFHRQAGRPGLPGSVRNGTRERDTGNRSRRAHGSNLRR